MKETLQTVPYLPYKYNGRNAVPSLTFPQFTVIVPTLEEMSDMDATMCDTLSEIFHEHSSHTSHAGDDIDTDCDNSDSSSSNVYIP